MITFILLLAVLLVIGYAIGRTLVALGRWVWRLAASKPYRDPDALAEAKRRNPWGG